MNLSEAKEIFETIKLTKHTSLMGDLVVAAIRYARIRTDCAIANYEERKDIDAARTATHNVFIDCCNILSRNMGKSGEDNSWRVRLTENRKVIGDFACYLHCILGIQVR